MDYSRITDQLYIGTTPSPADFELLRRLGVQLVINMRLLRGRGPEKGDPSVRYLRLATFDNPLLPIPASKLLRGVQAAIEVMDTGGKVYAHCSRGRHRSVAMAAAILIARGMSASEAMKLIREQRAAADPDAPHIRKRIIEFARRWSNHIEGDRALAG